MASSTVSGRDARQVAALLGLPEIVALIADLDQTRWTGRPGYPLRVMVGAMLVKAVYALPTWSRTTRLIAEHAALRAAIGGAPSQWACYRFTAKLRTHGGMLAACVDRVLACLHAADPALGQIVAIDGSDLPAYANGHRHLFKNGPARLRFADPDASWGHRSAVSTRRGGGYYGYKLHAAVCVRTGLPVAWAVRAAGVAEQEMVPGLLATLAGRGFAPHAAVMDKGYDGRLMYQECHARGIRPVIALRQTPGTPSDHGTSPSCQHGGWAFAGADTQRAATKWRCPAGTCRPASVWIKASRLHPLIPRHTSRWKALYRQRTAIEREFGQLKHEWGLLPLRVRSLPRVALHADLTILTQLTIALIHTRSHPASHNPPA